MSRKPIAQQLDRGPLATSKKTAAVRGRSPQGSLRFDVAADCFLAEPSRHLDRLQSFPMRECACIGIPEDVSDFRTCMSFNHHRDHFGVMWNIKDANNAPAHAGCVAFGMERLAVAMFHTHGTMIANWPASVRKLLGLQ